MPAVARQTVSACIIAANEQAPLPGALASVAFCDEVVVVDGGSRDDTVAVARAAGARVVENPWPGFGAQRNVAIDHATGDWVLEVDADERITPRLQQEILAFLEHPPADVRLGAVPCRDVLLGRPIGPAARYPKYRYRFFRRADFRHDEGRTVHEGLWADGRVWAFAGDLEHLLAGSWGEAVRDAWAYARLEAAQAPAVAGASAHVKAVALRPLVKLAYRSVVLGGWRDGWRGLFKIGLDVGSDVLVAAHGLRAPRQVVAGSAVHYGGQAPARGPVRLVAVAATGDAEAATRWLAGARAAGADVGLVCDGGPPIDPSELHSRRVAGLGPLNLARALDAEQQLRAVDGLVAIGRKARRALALVPAPTRSLVVDGGGDPSETVIRLAARRGARAGGGLDGGG